MFLPSILTPLITVLKTWGSSMNTKCTKEALTMGVSARATLGCGTYPSRCFQPKKPIPLFDLLTELNMPFQTSYSQWAPSAEDQTKISKPISKFDNPTLELIGKIIHCNKGWQQLQSSTFFIQEIKKALDKEDWSVDDKADRDLPISSLTGNMAKQKQIKDSQLQKVCNQWESSRQLPQSSKCGASPTPELSNSKCRCTTASESQSMGWLCLIA